MANDFEDVLTRTAVDSNIVRLRPNAHVQIYESGTETLTWEGLTDASGHFAVPSLPTGQYDLKVDGALVKSFHHVKADHLHNPNETWIMTRHGAQTVNRNEDQNCAVFAAPAAGTIIKIVAVAERIAAAGDITIHLLKGDSNPDIAVAVDEAVTMGLVFAVAGVEGLTLSALFRPS